MKFINSLTTLLVGTFFGTSVTYAMESCSDFDSVSSFGSYKKGETAYHSDQHEEICTDKTGDQVNTWQFMGIWKPWDGKHATIDRWAYLLLDDKCTVQQIWQMKKSATDECMEAPAWSLESDQLPCGKTIDVYTSHDILDGTHISCDLGINYNSNLLYSGGNEGSTFYSVYPICMISFKKFGKHNELASSCGSSTHISPHWLSIWEEEVIGGKWHCISLNRVYIYLPMYV